ncbi:hypothetical protein C1N53_19195 [Pontibacter sp. SGAir0037]|nr:hypothetical protein C1N53_19195 [Pontibacter sp. SGAir0037]
MAGCTAPRSVINSGKVTAPGQIRVGFNAGGNIATSPLSQLDDITKAAVDALAREDSVYYNSQIDVASKALVAYALDPVGPTFDFYVRYGLAPRFDVGYKYASGAHVLDAMYQFMGPTGTFDNPGAGDWYGSVGIQYAGQQSGIINKLFLNKLQPVIGFTASRRDVVIPLIFSKSFGVEEEKGHIAFGAVYNHTFIKYGFEPGRLFKKYGEDIVRVDAFTERNNFPSFGIFVNGKIGYRYVYLLPALTMYYQNYGSYPLLENNVYSFSGMTIIPSLGLQFQFGAGKSK